MTRARAWALLTLFLLPSICMGHSLSVAHVNIEFHEDGRGAAVALDLDLRDVMSLVVVDKNLDDAVTWRELAAARPEFEALVKQKVRLSSAGGRCRLEVQEMGLRNYSGKPYVGLVMQASCPSLDALEIGYQLLFDQDPSHRALVSSTRQGVGATTIMRSDQRISLVLPSERGAFAAFLKDGVHHILIGYDHLAFLLTLLLPAALVRDGKHWRPVSAPMESLRRVVALVTAFTVAHALTLGLATMGWVRPSGSIVEVVIAASVLVAALNNLLPMVTGRLWLVGFGFGLVHGFGFAGALAEIGLPPGARFEALLGFNLGVEAGQLAIVAVVFPLIYLARKQRWYIDRAMPAASIGVALVAVLWIAQRLAAA